MKDEKGRFVKGNKPWNTGSVCGSKYSKEHIENMSRANKGRTSPNKGKKLSDEQKRKMVETRKRNGSYLKGELSPWWKGGKGYLNENDKIRKSNEYISWRKSVFVRDNFTCVWCGIKGGRLNADHIKPFSLFPDLRFSLGNGRTLCHPCHTKTDTYGIKAAKMFFPKEVYKAYLYYAYK